MDKKLSGNRVLGKRMVQNREKSEVRSYTATIYCTENLL